MTDATHKSLFAALAAAQTAMGPALKDTKNEHFKSKYADLASVMAACMPALNANGIAVIQPPYQDENGNRFVKTIFVHGETGATAECSVPLIVAKNDMQAYGSAVTYARRYGLMSMAGIAPEDDDGNAAAKAPPQQDQRQDTPRPTYNPAPFIAQIEAAMTGTELRAAITQDGCDNNHPAIAAARIDRLNVLVNGAQTVVVLDAFQRAFAPDWAKVEAVAMARRNELTNADLGSDEIPY